MMLCSRPASGRRRVWPRWLFVLVCLLAMAACGRREAPSVDDPVPSVYYWRSRLTLTGAERQFIDGHHIGRVYLHLFDVVRRRGQGLYPQATLSMVDTLPVGVEVVPVVFLAPDVMADTTGLSALPQLVARRVWAMMEQNGYAAPREVQIDFDWTLGNQARYYEVLTALRARLQSCGCRLSATIRLHQLSMLPPPVDYGVLMAYNVGQLRSPDEVCSILTPQGVAPYLRHLATYDLPLCAALPVFRWNLLFRGSQFECIVHGIDLSDTTRFVAVDSVHYRAVTYQVLPPNDVVLQGNGRIYPGDVVRREAVSASVLLRVRQMLERARPGVCRQVVLFHLDSQHLNHYTYDQVDEVLCGR